MIVNSTNAGGALSAAQLRTLPPHERDAILEAAAIEAEAEYRTDPQLTDFEAFGKDDLHGESTATRAN